MGIIWTIATIAWLAAAGIWIYAGTYWIKAEQPSSALPSFAAAAISLLAAIPSGLLALHYLGVIQ